MDRIIKFYQYCDIQPLGTKAYLPLLNPTNINARINTGIIETIYSEKFVPNFDRSKKDKKIKIKVQNSKK